MDAERARAFLLSLPHAVETVQWGDNLVFWAGDKSLGGRMFALMDLTLDRGLVLSFAAGPERAAALLELPGFHPAPYLARAHWVSAESWALLRDAAWQDELRAAHGYVFGRLPVRMRTGLENAAAGDEARRSTSARLLPGSSQKAGKSSGGTRKAGIPRAE